MTSSHFVEVNKVEKGRNMIRQIDYMRWAVTLIAATVMRNKRARMINKALKRTIRGILNNDKY